MSEHEPDPAGAAAASPPPAESPGGGRVVYGLRIAAVRLRFIGLLVAVVLVVGYWDAIKARFARWTHGEEDVATGAVEGVEFYCPMHPHIVRDVPGSCPICGMPLSARKKGGKTATPEGVLARVQLSPYRIAQAGIHTSTVDWRPLEREVTTVGSVEYDERTLARISARFAGRIESLAVAYTGASVERGAPLASIYSPDLYAAQESLLSADAALAALRGASPVDPSAISRQQALVEASRSRLLLWGLWEPQVEAILKAGKAQPAIEILAPLSGTVTRKAIVVGDYVMEGGLLFDIADLSHVWVTARVFEDDLGLVGVGARMEATASAFPGETFEGPVTFVDRFIDRTTRTAVVRADLPNPAGQLRPGLYVTARLKVSFADVEPFRSLPRPPPGPPRTVYVCEMHPEIVRDAPGECELCGGMKLEPKEIPSGPGPKDVLAVPESAVVDTGRRKVVYVESSPGVFDAKEVVLGPRAGDFYPVVRGIEAGMRVATAGSFLIDAETRLNPAAAGTYFGASGKPEGRAGGPK